MDITSFGGSRLATFPSKTSQEIKNRASLVEETGRAVSLTRRGTRPRAKPIAIDYERVGAGTWRHVKAITRPAGQRVVPLPGAAN